MPKYGFDVDNFTSPTGTADSAASLQADAAGDEGECVYAQMTGSGVTATGADNPHSAGLRLCTFATAGTGTAVTEGQFSQVAQAPRCAGQKKYTAEPTAIDAEALVFFGFNQRGGDKWGVPHGIGEGIRIHNADSKKGIVFTVVAGTAGAVDASIHWFEP